MMIINIIMVIMLMMIMMIMIIIIMIIINMIIINFIIIFHDHLNFKIGDQNRFKKSSSEPLPTIRKPSIFRLQNRQAENPKNPEKKGGRETAILRTNAYANITFFGRFQGGPVLGDESVGFFTFQFFCHGNPPMLEGGFVTQLLLNNLWTDLTGVTRHTGPFSIENFQPKPL